MIVKAILISTLCFLKISCPTSKSSIVKKSLKIEKVAEPAELGEEPHWDVRSQKLYYVDVLKGHKIIRYDPVTGNRTYATLDWEYLGPVIPIEGTTDKLIVGVDRNVVIVTWNGEQTLDNPPIEQLSSLDTDRNDTRVNDGKCDAVGRFWVGTMAFHVNGYVKPDRGSLYRIGIDGRADKIISPISVGNGLTWSLKNDIMYYIDTPTHQISAFDFNIIDGTLSNRRVVFDTMKNNLPGVPDGMTNDADGNLWVALFGGKAIIQIDPKTGKLLRKIEMPVENISSMAFGGPNFDDLYVTTARFLMTDEEIQKKPDSGSLYRITDLGVKGLPPHNCKYNP